MRTTIELPDELLKAAKLTALNRNLTLKDLIKSSLEHELYQREVSSIPHRMNQPPIRLSKAIPVRSNAELAKMLDEEDSEHLHEIYHGR